MQMMMSFPEIKIDWIPRRLRRGDKAMLKLKLEIPEGYHIQAHKPAEELMIPTDISLDEAEGIKLGDPIYPEPKELPVSWSEVKILTYEGEIEIDVPVQVAGDAKPGERKIEGTLSYQSCTANACMPPREQKFTVKLELF